MICFYCIFILTGIVAAVLFLLAWLREVAHSLQVADDTSHIVDILRVAVGTLLEIAFVDMSALITDGVGNVESEIL